MCEHVTLTEPALVQNLVLWHFVYSEEVCVFLPLLIQVFFVFQTVAVFGGMGRSELYSSAICMLYYRKAKCVRDTRPLKLKLRLEI